MVVGPSLFNDLAFYTKPSSSSRFNTKPVCMSSVPFKLFNARCVESHMQCALNDVDGSDLDLLSVSS